MKNFIRYSMMLITTTSLLYAAGLNKYNIVKPDGTVDSVGLNLSVLDIYNTFQPRKFNKLNTIPNANQIGEQQLVLYRSTSTNNARIYTIIDNTTYYVSVGTIAWISGTNADLLDGYNYDYFATTITTYNLALATGTNRTSITALEVSTGTLKNSTTNYLDKAGGTCSGTITFSSATFSGKVGVGTTSDTYAMLVTSGNSDAEFAAKIVNTGVYGLSIKTDGTTGAHDQLKISDNSGTIFAVYGGGSTNISGNANIKGIVTASTITITGDIYTNARVDYYASSSITGWQTSGRTGKIMVKRIGKTVLVDFYISGTSNANNVTFTLPYTSANDTSLYPTVFALGLDNSVTTIARIDITPNSNTINCYKDYAATAWTTSGTKYIYGQFHYESQ